MRMSWIASLSAIALISAAPGAFAQEQPKDKPVAGNKQGEASKPEKGKSSGQDGQAVAPSSNDTASGSSDNSGSATTGSSTGGFSSSGRLNDPSPSRAMQPGGQY